MSIKQLFKQIPVLGSAAKWMKKTIVEKRRKMLNNKYLKELNKLHNSQVFRDKIRIIRSKIEKGGKLKYYIISSQNTKMGICGYITFFLPHIAYAVSKGYVPVIDLQTYPNIYQTTDKKHNSWELFFEQPFAVSLEDVKPRDCIKCPLDYWYSGTPHCIPMMDETEVSFWKECYSLLVHPNARTSAYLNKEVDSILKNRETTIGAIFRGTDYTQGHPIGHPIQPTYKMLSMEIKDLFSKEGYEKVYIASDEKKIVDYLKKEFPGRVLINSRCYYDEVETIDYSNCNNDHLGITAVRFDRDDDEYLRGVEYLSSINIVAHCGAFVAGGCGGTIAALYMSESHFKKTIVFQLGRYGFDSIPEDD